MITRFLEELGLTKRRGFLIVLALLVWISAIIASGAGWNPFANTWDFSNSGAFGDSFGPLSALMASLAALGAIATYRAQASEIGRVREREEELDKAASADRERAITREFLADERALRQNFESTYFQLLEMLRSLVNTLDVEIYVGDIEKGHDAFKALLEAFKAGSQNPDADKGELWLAFSNKYKNDLNHYFRLMYHIVKFIKYSEIDNRYFYIQLLRSMLSDSELALLSLNCEYGYGRDKFKELIEEFALLHNLSEAEKDYWDLESKFKPEAFEFRHADSVFEFVESEDISVPDKV